MNSTNSPNDDFNTAATAISEPTGKMVTVGRLWPGMLLISVFALVMWRLALFTGRTVIHGDMIGFGLPLFELAGRAAWGDASTLWASGVYGGHPLFAEGQGAFASPLTVLIAYVVTPIAGPIFAMNFFQFLSLLLTGAGTLGLCRQLKFSAVACTFAALAVTFSPLWIFVFQGNPVLAGTFLWVPWCLWTLETWLQKPDLRASAFVGSTCAAMFLAGYSPGLHATLLYMLIRVMVEPIDRHVRAEWKETWCNRMIGGLAAVIIFVGLSAIQWIPLLELVTQSHRNAGTSLILIPDSMSALRGIFYGNRRPDAFLSVGSTLIVALAIFAVFGARSLRITGHLIAALVLMQLSFSSVLFRFVYDHHLIPGLHFVRVTVQFMAPGIIGIIIIAASSIDALVPWFRAQTPIKRSVVLGCVLTMLACSAAMLYTPDASVAQLAIALLAFVVVIALYMSRNDRYVPMALLILLVAECSFRLLPIQMVRTENLQMPASVSAIQATKNWADFKVLDTTIALTYAMKYPQDKNLTADMKNMLSAMSGLTSTIWGLHSMDGALALPLARHNMLTQPILDEIHGDGMSPPGLRLIDTLGIRYIATYGPAKDGLALHPFWHNGDAPWILENTAALPRFQVYSDHVTVDTPDAALAFMQTWTKRTLVIENPSGPNHQTEPTDTPLPAATSPGSSPLRFEISKASDTSYHVNLQATKPCWFFLADANYPGWKAYLDGRPVALFSAQVLGKAVAVPEGHHDLVISFESASFRWGASISLATLILTVLILWLNQWRKRGSILQDTSERN